MGLQDEEEPHDYGESHAHEECQSPVNVIDEGHNEHEEANLIHALEEKSHKYHIELFLSRSLWIPFPLATCISANTAQSHNGNTSNNLRNPDSQADF